MNILADPLFNSMLLGVGADLLNSCQPFIVGNDV